MPVFSQRARAIFFLLSVIRTFLQGTEQRPPPAAQCRERPTRDAAELASLRQCDPEGVGQRGVGPTTAAHKDQDSFLDPSVNSKTAPDDCTRPGRSGFLEITFVHLGIRYEILVDDVDGKRGLCDEALV